MRLYRITRVRRYLLLQTPGIEAVACAEHDVLLSVEQIGDDAARLVGAHLAMPEHLAFVGAVDDGVLLVVAGDNEIGRRGEDAGAQGARSIVQVGIRVFPRGVAGERIDGMQNALRRADADSCT